MTLISQWRSAKGQKTPDNRDAFAYARKQNEALYIIADGATSKIQSGLMASVLCSKVINTFKQTSFDPIEDLLSRLPEWQVELRRLYPVAAVSYLIARVQVNNLVQTLHTGDCRLGFAPIISPERIDWKTSIHSLANAINSQSEDQLRKHAGRHSLTRTFNSRHYMQPEYQEHHWSKGSVLIMATDGFWAERSPDEQCQQLSDYSSVIQQPKDDCSYLLLTQPDSVINFRTELINHLLEKKHKSS